jgi:hypothetical protein
MVPSDPPKKELEKIRIYGSVKLTSGNAKVKVNLFGIPVGYSHNFGGSEQQYKAYVDLYPSGKIEGGVSFTQKQAQSGDSYRLGPYDASTSKSKEINYSFSSDEGSKVEKNPWRIDESAGAKDVSVSNNSNVETIELSAEVGLFLVGGGAGVGVEYYWYPQENGKTEPPKTKGKPSKTKSSSDNKPNASSTKPKEEKVP